MTQFERALGGAAALTIGVALIASALAGWASYKRTGRRISAVASALLTGSLVCAAGVTLQPAPGPGGVELLPFTNLSSPSGDDQLVANLLLMLPTGAALGLLRPLRSAVVIGTAICAGTEFVQALPQLGRVAATEDFLLNSVGLACGAILSRSLVRCRRREAIAVPPRHSDGPTRTPTGVRESQPLKGREPRRIKVATTPDQHTVARYPRNDRPFLQGASRPGHSRGRSWNVAAW